MYRSYAHSPVLLKKEMPESTIHVMIVLWKVGLGLLLAKWVTPGAKHWEPDIPGTGLVVTHPHSCPNLRTRGQTACYGKSPGLAEQLTPVWCVALCFMLDRSLRLLNQLEVQGQVPACPAILQG